RELVNNDVRFLRQF
ncbi:MAG: hypothetical protein ACPHFO_08760, partial [Acidimicrobiales bacterium]